MVPPVARFLFHRDKENKSRSSGSEDVKYCFEKPSLTSPIGYATQLAIIRVSSPYFFHASHLKVWPSNEYSARLDRLHISSPSFSILHAHITTVIVYYIAG